jgi:hypothetical protein
MFGRVREASALEVEPTANGCAVGVVDEALVFDRDMDLAVWVVDEVLGHAVDGDVSL